MKALLNIDKLCKLYIQPEGEGAKLTVQIGHEDKKTGPLHELEWSQVCFAVARISGLGFENAKDHLQDNLVQLTIYEETLGRQSAALDDVRTQLTSAHEQITQLQSTTQTLEAKCSELETTTSDAVAKKGLAEGSINAVRAELDTAKASLSSAENTLSTLQNIIDDLQGKLRVLTDGQAPLGHNIVESGEATAVVTHDIPPAETPPAEPAETPPGRSREKNA